MPEQINDGALESEAKVISEQVPKQEDSPRTAVAEVVTPKSEETPAKKKKNPIVLILMVLFGLAVICCSCAVGGFFALNYAVQNSSQAVVVKGLYTALNDGDKAKVKMLTSTELYTDLYKPLDDGSTLADLMKSNIEKVTVTSINVTNDTASVKYTITVKNNAELFKRLGYAEFSKNPSASDDVTSWIVTFIGPVPTSAE